MSNPESAHGAGVTPPAMEAWRSVWEKRELDATRGSVLAQIMAADGLDTGFGDVDEVNWTEAVGRRAVELRITPATSVFEVGCGAGAFLYELHRRGCRVSGIDQSARLIGFARQALRGGDFEVEDAIDIDIHDEVDVVVSCGVFLYFPSLEYARGVIERMVRKARTAVAILDVPDAATQPAALAHRVAVAGGEAAYERRYRGLDHRYYDRDWVAEVLRGCGLVDVQVADQDIAGYSNAGYRFNAWGFVAQSR